MYQTKSHIYIYIYTAMLKFTYSLSASIASDVRRCSFYNFPAWLLGQVLHIHISSEYLITNEIKAAMTKCLYDALHISSSTTENSSLPQTTFSLMNLLENLVVTSTSTTLTSAFSQSILTVFQYCKKG